MKTALISLLFAVFILAPKAVADVSIVGNWQYDGFFYEGNRYPNPNPKLVLTFTFNADGSERLYWARSGEKGFCERKGTYLITGDTLEQNATWINPDNDASCAQDPDMQMGQKTKNQFSLGPDGKELNIHMDIDGKPFIYILKQITSLPALVIL